MAVVSSLGMHDFRLRVLYSSAAVFECLHCQSRCQFRTGLWHPGCGAFIWRAPPIAPGIFSWNRLNSAREHPSPADFAAPCASQGSAGDRFLSRIHFVIRCSCSQTVCLATGNTVCGIVASGSLWLLRPRPSTEFQSIVAVPVMMRPRVTMPMMVRVRPV